MKIDIDSFEENFSKPNRREEKKEKKLKRASDQSKYKKTDLAKAENKTVSLLDETLLERARVLSIYGDEALAQKEDGSTVTSYLRGSLKKDKTELRNIIAVGDFVLLNPRDKKIEKIEKRSSLLSREDTLRKKQHIIAANIDQVLITVSVVSPPLKPALVDRYIISAIKGHLSPIIIINKIDLLKKRGSLVANEKALYQEFVKSFSCSDIPIISVSTKTKEGLDELKKLMKDKASVFAGQSGSGKTSLINALTSLQLKTGNVVKKTAKGSHTTTKAELIPLKEGGFCIDTPGIKSFGLWKIEKRDLIEYFSEIFHMKEECRYPNCTHMYEPGCKVLSAVEEGKISSLRFASYQSLMEEMSEENRNR